MVDFAGRHSQLLIGSGAGEKAGQLSAAMPELVRLGVRNSGRACIGMDRTAPVLELIRKTGNLDESAQGDPLLDALRQDLDHAYASLGRPRFLAVRSSADGDAAGTGVYTSRLIRVDSNDQIFAAALDVLNSHEWNEARTFRADENLKDGMALMIEPVIGDHFACSQTGRSYFGPVLNFIINTASTTPLYLTPGLGNPTSLDASISHSDIAVTRWPSGQLNLRAFDSIVSAAGKGIPSACEDGSKPTQCSLDPALLASTLRLGSPVVNVLARLVAEYSRDTSSNTYLEGAINAAGDVHVTQFSKGSSRTIQLPTAETLDAKWLHAASPVGAVSLDGADLIVINPSVSLTMDALGRMLLSRTFERRSAVVILPQRLLQTCFESPRQLWGTFRNVGAVICLDSAVRTRPIESHFQGSIRAANGFGFCVVPSDFRPIHTPYSFYDCESGADISMHPKAVNVRILEGRGAWLSGPAIPAPLTEELGLNLPMPDADFAMLANAVGGANGLPNTRGFLRKWEGNRPYREFAGFSSELRSAANRFSYLEESSPLAEDEPLLEIVRSVLVPRGITTRQLVKDLYTISHAIVSSTACGGGNPYASFSVDSLSADGMPRILAALQIVADLAYKLPIGLECAEFLQILRYNMCRQNVPVID